MRVLEVLLELFDVANGGAPECVNRLVRVANYRQFALRNIGSISD